MNKAFLVVSIIVDILLFTTLVFEISKLIYRNINKNRNENNQWISF